MLEIKKSTKRREVNISEWNPDVKAYVRDLNGFERLTFLDQLDQFQNRDLPKVDRVEAGIAACIMALVDENGNQLLSLDQIDELKEASYNPIWRVLNLLINTDARDESLKNG